MFSFAPKLSPLMTQRHPLPLTYLNERLAGLAGWADLSVACWEVDDSGGLASGSWGFVALAGRKSAVQNSAGLRLVGPVRGHSGPVGRTDLRSVVAGHSLVRLVGRTAVADRIGTSFWKVGIAGSSDELKSSWK